MVALAHCSRRSNTAVQILHGELAGLAKIQYLYGWTIQNDNILLTASWSQFLMRYTILLVALAQVYHPKIREGLEHSGIASLQRRISIHDPDTLTYELGGSPMNVADPNED